LKDAEIYEEKKLNTLLLDEAQVVKNFNSKTNKALSALSVEHVFALSGTPIENKLDEIWAIFNIVMPGFLPARRAFNKLRPEYILRQIAPFVLRRKKEEVLKELPDKLEITQLSELTDEQKVVYLAQLDAMQQQFGQLSSQDFSKNRMQILAGITRLRQICDTPALFAPDYKGSSGKLDSLYDLLIQVKDSGRRPLIFSQFTKMFPYIEALMDKVGLTRYKLTGSTASRDRIDMVRAFNAGSRDAFLISLKAGGVGLNLASSDMVILVDLWWNPAVEEQAVSRAHRMGQKNMVEVIRLITKGTIEEKIIDIQKRKKDLFTAILDNTETARSLTQADINEILGIKP
jgi:SNF2 family DNA or RNA helicase